MDQSVQRCKLQSDERFGPIHQIGENGHTLCGINFSGPSFWILGPTAEFPPTCKECKAIKDE